MNRIFMSDTVIFISVLFLITIAGTNKVFAHCDGMDGPVVKAAHEALNTGNVNLVLIWVSKEDEDKIKEAFKQTQNVRKLSPEARQLADKYFFETLVRIHRASEGAPYTGLKPAGRKLIPSIQATDEAIESENVKPLVNLLTEQVTAGTQKHFNDVMARKDYGENNVVAGREYVKSYVEFIHYTKRIYKASVESAPGHYSESD